MSCPECFQGTVHEGTPRGETTTLHGLDTYVVHPADGRASRGIIVIIPDAFGWAFVNSRLLADRYADKGLYTVYLPDFMLGTAAPLYMLDAGRAFFDAKVSLFVKPYHLVRLVAGFVPFIWHNRPGVAAPRIRAWFAALRVAEGADARIAAAGFCWGGKHVALLSHADAVVDIVTVDADSSSKTTAPLINAGFTGHPSMLDIPADLGDAVAVPLSFALGTLDTLMPPAQINAIRALVEAKPPPATGEVVVYTGAGHGFCVRADTSNSDSDRQAVEAEDQAISWFNKHLL